MNSRSIKAGLSVKQAMAEYNWILSFSPKTISAGSISS